MPAELRTLLAHRELGLRLLGEASALPAGALERPIPWVHSSDLVDPTPFLAEGHVLLTTGTQFGTDAAPDDTQAEAYVARLVARGIGGLGFGTEVVRSGTPDALIDACREAGLPLFEVPYRTPFIAVVQANAAELAREAGARSAWALTAQRAISLAAMRPDGFSAILAELSTQLGCWVGLFDASGALARGFPAEGPGAVDAEELALVAREAARLLRSGRRASLPVRAERNGFTLQTLGAHGELHGVLAIAAIEALDQAGREVVTSVIALASLGLQQSRELHRARGLLRTGLLRVLQTGDPSVAETASAQLWGPLPPEPIQVAVLAVEGGAAMGTDAGVAVRAAGAAAGTGAAATSAATAGASTGRDAASTISESLELWVASHPGRLYFAQDGELVLCLPAGDPGPLPGLVADEGLHVGLSEPTGYAEFAQARRQATQALRRGADGPARIVPFDELARGGVLGLLAHTDAGEVARSVLTPLREHDARHGTELQRTVRVWLECSCEFDAAARRLGVHRHTARSRIDAAGRLLGRDLGSFAVRAELWAAFLALR